MNVARRTSTWVALCVAVLVGCMCLLGMPHRQALADGSYTIEVTDTKEGSTYKAYKVFDVVYSGDNYAYSISSDNPFFAIVQSSGLFSLEKTGTNGSVTTYSVMLNDASSTDMAPLAAQLSALSSLDSLAGAASDSAAADGAKVTLTVTNPGYYFVTTTTGTICSLDTTNPTAEVKDKNSSPSVQKLVQEPSVNNGDYGYVAQNDASIGDPVQFRTKITITRGAKNYVLHDKLSSGLTLDKNSFKLGESPNPEAATNLSGVPEAYKDGATFRTENLADNCSFELELSNELHASFTKDVSSKELYVFYTATLNENAVVGEAGNVNETYLSYGQGLETDKSVTKTYTWPVTVVKYTGSDPSQNHLAGATFTLSKATVDGDTWTATGNALKFIASANGTTYTLAPTSYTGATVDSITTTSSGTFTLSGLDSGSYLLTETAAPAGYNKLGAPIRVNIGVNYDMSKMTMGATYTVTGGGGDNSGTVGTGATDASIINVQNNTGSQIPTTGGRGTRMLYTVGIPLIVVSTAVLVTRRRLGTN